MSQDTNGNYLLPGDESDMFRNRSIAPSEKQHFKRKITAPYSGDTTETDGGEQNGGSRRRRPSRKYKKSSRRVFRKKSRSTRRR
jgi:hypothetical protein